MSLFKTKEWWSTKIGEGDEFDGSSLCVARLFSLDDDERDQLVIGGQSGTLWVFDPGCSLEEAVATWSFKPEHMLVEKQMDGPIVQVAAGRLVSGAKNQQLAVLFPRKLVVFDLRMKESSVVEHGSQFTLNLLYEHSMQRTSFNITIGPFGGVQEDYMCVQSLDGTLSFFESENFAFCRFLPGALLPGPFVFVPLADSFVVAAGNWSVESYKYQVLAVAADSKSKEDAATVSSGKRVATDWSCQLGECVVDISVMEMSPAQPSVLILGERNLFCFTEGGTMRFQHKLDYNPLCLLGYAASSEGYLQYAISTDTNTITFYNDSTLVWTAKTPYSPIALRRTGFGHNFRGYLVCLDDSGYLSVCYLGSDPALFGLPQTDVRHVDLAERQKELRQLQKIIQGHTGKGIELNTTQRVGEDLSITSKVAEALDSTSLAYDTKIENEPVPSISVRITLSAKVPISNVHLFVKPSPPIVPHQSAFTFPTLSGSEELPVTFYVGKALIPCSLTVFLVAVYDTVGGSSRVSQSSFSLPLNLIATVASASKSATHKVTLESNKGVLSISDIFNGVYSPEGDGAYSLGFQLLGTSFNVSLLVSKNTQKYRVQSESFEAIWIFLNEFVKQINQKQGGSSGDQLSYVSTLPLQEYFALLDHHFELQARKKKLEELLEKRCIQLRVVQAQLLTKFKDTTPTPLAHLDALYEMTYRQVLTIATAIADLQAGINSKNNGLSAATEILLLLIRQQSHMQTTHFNQLRAALTPLVAEFPEQTWEERTDVSVTHLLHIITKGHAATSPVSQNIPKLIDSSRLKKHVTLLCEKVGKGSTQLQNNAVERVEQKRTPTTAIGSRLGGGGGRLETIMEDTNAIDASEQEFGEVPSGSQFGGVMSGALQSSIENDQQRLQYDGDDDFVHQGGEFNRREVNDQVVHRDQNENVEDGIEKRKQLALEGTDGLQTEVVTNGI